ncbi:FadR/GntR family transcriptional regulator [Jiangella asiatica]|uniref:FadR family transcriptional regulator n=1 Tax=Jiangella asiatica TaxID=2530372 RepID=A0A4R5DJY8_9ACTN|nr:FadR/GntR family transcriptional regulator [Jiangella asiatica]TDE11155.1 FadR family transcriptional regulator [Jiangella asiatica]
MHDERGPSGRGGHPLGDDPAETGTTYRPGYEIAAERILEHIASQQLRPGDRVGTERDIALTLDISRTVTREAVKILSALGRLTVRKGSGVHVAEPTGRFAPDSWSLFLPADPDQVRMLFELRRTLEVAASEFAASRATPHQVRAVRGAARRSADAAEDDDFDRFRQADEEFHRAVAAATNNTFFESTVGVITQLKRQVLTIGLRGGQSGSLVVAAKEHTDIADAVASGDAERAGAAMAQHIDGALVQFQHEIRRRVLGVDLPPGDLPESPYAEDR